jgi:hypothetical protein
MALSQDAPISDFPPFFAQFSTTRALSLTSVKSTDHIVRDSKSKKKRGGEVILVENLSQAPPSNSTKSSRRRVTKEYSPFGGLEIEGCLNLNFKPRLMRKKVNIVNERQQNLNNIVELEMHDFKGKNNEKYAKNQKNQAMYIKRTTHNLNNQTSQVNRIPPNYDYYNNDYQNNNYGMMNQEF